MITVQVELTAGGRHAACTLEVSETTTIAALIAKATAASPAADKLGAVAQPWQAYYQGTLLSTAATLAEAIPEHAALGVIHLSLVCGGSGPALPMPAPAAAPALSAKVASAPTTPDDWPSVVPPFLQAPAATARAAAAPAAAPAASEDLDLSGMELDFGFADLDDPFASVDEPADEPSVACEPIATTPGPAGASAMRANRFAAKSLAGNHADPPRTTRHASVRYYRRMIPSRQYDFNVVLSRQALRGRRRGAVTLTDSVDFQAEKDKPLEVELVLPGCHVHCLPNTPSRNNRAIITRLDDAPLEVGFTVIPYASGNFEHCQAVVYSGDDVVLRIPLEIVVRRTTISYVLGIAAVVIPLFFDQIVSILSDHGARWGGLSLRNLAIPVWVPLACTATLLFAAALYFIVRLAPRAATANLT